MCMCESEYPHDKVFPEWFSGEYESRRIRQICLLPRKPLGRVQEDLFSVFIEVDPSTDDPRHCTRKRVTTPKL